MGSFPEKILIRHFTNNEESWEFAFAKMSGIVNEDGPVSYWSMFSLSLVTGSQ